MKRSDFLKALIVLPLTPTVLAELGEEQFDFPMTSNIQLPRTGLLSRGGYNDLLRPGLKKEFHRAYSQCPREYKSFMVPR